VGLPHDRRAGFPEAADDLGVRERRAPIGAGAMTRQLTRDVHVVLDRDGNAEQRRLLPSGTALVGPVSLLQGTFPPHHPERVEVGIELPDPV
jgi:hypothetical protein